MNSSFLCFFLNVGAVLCRCFHWTLSWSDPSTLEHKVPFTIIEFGFQKNLKSCSFCSLNRSLPWIQLSKVGKSNAIYLFLKLFLKRNNSTYIFYKLCSSSTSGRPFFTDASYGNADSSVTCMWCRNPSCCRHTMLTQGVGSELHKSNRMVSWTRK